MTISIRDLRTSDIEPLQQIDKAAHGQAWSRRLFLDEIEQPDRIHLVASDADGSPIGHAAVWLDQSIGRVTNVAVADGAQGNGVATALLARLLRLLAETPGIDSVALEVRSDNRRAQRLYMQFGFAPVGIERNFYSWGDQRDALAMVIHDVGATEWRNRLELFERPAA